MKLSKKYRGFGLHVWCNQCKKTVTNHPCTHTARHVYQSRVYNPYTKRQDTIKTWPVTSQKEAWELHNSFKKTLEENHFTTKPVAQNPGLPKDILRWVTMYENFIKDIGVPDYEKKHRSHQYIIDQTRYLRRFMACLKSTHGSLGRLLVTSIGSKDVEAFHQYVNGLNLSDRSYNAHIDSIWYLFEFIKKRHDGQLSNPFEFVTKKKLHYDPEIITEPEFEKLLHTITYANGWATVGRSTPKKRNYYRPWLTDVYKLAIMTGERLDGLTLLQWKHVKENYIIIPNWKVNRAQNTQINKSYTPITSDLAELLLKLGPADPHTFVIVPGMENRNTLKSLLSKSFTHYWQQCGFDKKATFKNLRKTYITRMYELLGDKAKGIKHTNDTQVLKHYLNERIIIDHLKGQKMYNFQPPA